jgi:hypothetical protein
MRRIPGLEEQEPLAIVLVYQWLSSRVGATNWMARAALLNVAWFAGLGLELADGEAVAVAVGVELALGRIAAAEAGIAGAGFQEFDLLVTLHFVGCHGGAALVAGEVIGVDPGITAGIGFAGGLPGHGEGRTSLGVSSCGGSETQTAEKGGSKQNFHISAREWSGGIQA